MLFVENCDLVVSRFCGDPSFCVFCYPHRSDDWDAIGEFKTKEEAESFLRYMQERGGRISDYRIMAENWGK